MNPYLLSRDDNDCAGYRENMGRQVLSCKFVLRKPTYVVWNRKRYSFDPHILYISGGSSLQQASTFSPAKPKEKAA